MDAKTDLFPIMIHVLDSKALGSVVSEICRGSIQASTRPLLDMDEVVIYRHLGDNRI